MECKSCGAQIADESAQCPYCQAAVTRTPAPNSTPIGTVPFAKAPPSKVAAGLCGILLGALGIHKFILGYQKAGFIMLGITVLTCGYGGIILGIIGLIEGIIYLTKSDEEFIQTYVNNKKEWF
jgi:TM2 domain-containing membrane protein YozV